MNTHTHTCTNISKQQKWKQKSFPNTKHLSTLKTQKQDGVGLTQAVVEVVPFALASPTDVFEGQVQVGDDDQGRGEDRSHLMLNDQLVALEHPDLT